MSSFLELFSYDFMLRALVVGVCIACAAALIGVPLVLKQKSMLSDGLSHVAFAAFVVAMVAGLSEPIFALPFVALVSFLLLRIAENSKLNGDALIALISASSLALGVFLISVSGTNIDINSYLFGSILGTSSAEVWLAIGVALMTFVFYLFCYHRIFALTFDEKFMKAVGLKTNFYHIILALICSVVIVVGMKLVGALLISSLIVFPTLSSRYLANSFRATIILSIVVSTFNFLVGLFLSYFLEIPTGATVVLVSLTNLILIKLFNRFI